MIECGDCQLCPHLVESRAQVVPGSVPESGRFAMMLVGEAPGENEDFEGEPFVGWSGQLLDRYLQDVGIDRAECGVFNVVRCRPPGNRDPLKTELANCSTYLLADLLRYRPKTVVALGKFSAAFFTDQDRVAITKVRGTMLDWVHPEDPTLVISVVFTLHPSYVGRCEREPDSPFPMLFRSDLSVAKSLGTADTERLPSNTGRREREPYMEGTRFITGWHVGDRIFLVYRGEDGRRILHRVEADYYFLIREEDLTPKARDAVAKVLRNGIRDRRHHYRIKRIERDEISGWMRVYPSVPDHWVSKEVKWGMTDEEQRRYVSVSPLLLLCQTFHALGVRTFEGDVDPLRRFVTDRAITVEAEHLRRLWIDIETDDKTMAGRPLEEVIGNVPILSIGCQLDDGRTSFRAVESTAPHHERELLTWFFHEMVPNVDMLCAWNGGPGKPDRRGFDYPFLWIRARLLGVKIAPQATIWWDPMFSFDKHHKWSSEKSLKLDRVGELILGRNKIERKGEHVFDLWADNRPKLEAYNIEDVDLMRCVELDPEKGTGYVTVDALQNSISNCFAGNTYIGLRVDGMVLVEGYRTGTHFRTKLFGAIHDDEQFTGAFVLDPTPGRYYDVANFDFSKLYPTTFQTFNISPDTYVPPADVPSVDPKLMTRCPEFVVDGVKKGGHYFMKEPAGVIPSIYHKVADGLSHYKKKAAAEAPLSPEWWRWRRLEYAYKELGLSMYGTMGSVYARIYNRAVAESVTLTAQFLTRITIELATRLGFAPIYGDTDSLFIQIPEDRVESFVTQSQSVYAHLTERFNCAQCTILLEHEQTFRVIVIIRKKRYFGHLTMQKGKPADAVEVKGLEMRRTDGVRFGRTVQTSLVNGVLAGWDLERTRTFLLRMRQRVIEGPMSGEDLQATAAITKSPHLYKGNSRQNPNVRLAEEMMARGEEVVMGQKMAWVVTEARKSPVEIVAVEDFDGHTYDRVYYWMKKVWPPVERIVKVLWPNVDWDGLMRVRRKPVRRKKVADGDVR